MEKREKGGATKKLFSNQKNIFSQRLPRGAQASLTCEEARGDSLHPGAERRTNVSGSETGAEAEEGAEAAAAEVADFLPTDEAAALAAARACVEVGGGEKRGKEERKRKRRV